MREDASLQLKLLKLISRPDWPRKVTYIFFNLALVCTVYSIHYMSNCQYIYNFHFITILGKAPDEDDIRIAKTTPGNDDQGATVQEEP